MLVVWDLRAFKKPLAAHTGLTTLYPTTNAIFSPDDKYVVTGAGATTKGDKGRLIFLKKDGLEAVKELVVDTTPVKVIWHSKINQVRHRLIVDCYSISTFPKDRNRTCQWPNLRALLSTHISKWSETAAKQGSSPKGYHRRYVRRRLCTNDYYSTCPADVPRWGDCEGK